MIIIINKYCIVHVQISSPKVAQGHQSQRRKQLIRLYEPYSAELFLERLMFNEC